MTREEVVAILTQLEGIPRLVALLLYGVGLRLLEGLQLRVKDVDFGARQLTIRSGKGNRDRVALLPKIARVELKTHLRMIRVSHQRDLEHGRGRLALSNALSGKYPTADWEWRWQWVFPATRTYRDPRTGNPFRHHLHETLVQRAVKSAVRASGLTKRATCHTLRHSFATHLLKDGTTSAGCKNCSATKTSARR